MSGAMVIMAMMAGFMVLLLAVSLWVAQRLPDGPVPVHFDIRLRPDKFGSRWIVLGLMPASYVFLAAVILVAVAGAEPDQAKAAEVLFGHTLASVIIVATHVFIAFLLLRWAGRQEN